MNGKVVKGLKVLVIVMAVCSLVAAKGCFGKKGTSSGKNEVDILRLKIAQLEDTNRRLEAQVQNKDLEIADLNKKIREQIELINQLTAMQAENAGLKDRISDLKKAIVDLEAQKAIVEDRGKDLQGIIDDERKEKANMAEKIGFLNGRIAALEKALKEQGKAIPPVVENKIPEGGPKPPDAGEGAVVGKTKEGFWTYRIESTLLFDSGQAVLRPGAKKILDEVAKNLKDNPALSNEFFFRIDGHTDIDPIKKPATKAKFATNWELSAARALTVLHYLEEKGIPSKNMSVMARSEYDPLVPGDTAAAKQQNRRVEIVLIPKDLKVKYESNKKDEKPEEKKEEKKEDPALTK